VLLEEEGEEKMMKKKKGIWKIVINVSVSAFPSIKCFIKRRPKQNTGLHTKN
jgi:hypothetical protein